MEQKQKHDEIESAHKMLLNNHFYFVHSFDKITGLKVNKKGSTNIYDYWPIEIDMGGKMLIF